MALLGNSSSSPPFLSPGENLEQDAFGSSDLVFSVHAIPSQTYGLSHYTHVLFSSFPFSSNVCSLNS